VVRFNRKNFDASFTFERKIREPSGEKIKRIADLSFLVRFENVRRDILKITIMVFFARQRDLLQNGSLDRIDEDQLVRLARRRE